MSAACTIPVAAIALVLGVHRILAEGLAFVNLVGNALAVVVIARWEGALDEGQMARTIGLRRGAAMPEQGCTTR